MFKESYKLYPGERASEAKPSGLQYSPGMNKYTFKITLDNGFEEKNIPIPLHRWNTAVIDIDWENEEGIIVMVYTV